MSKIDKFWFFFWTKKLDFMWVEKTN